jgi:hypothetical protein
MSAWLFWVFILPFLIGLIGETMKKLVLGSRKPKSDMPFEGYKGWRGVYFVTYTWHAILFGAAIGRTIVLAGVPYPVAFFGEGIWSGVLVGAFSGGLAMVGHATIVKTIENMYKNAGARAVAKAAELFPQQGGGTNEENPGETS